MIARVYQYIRWLSLDISAGAIVLMAFISQEFKVNFNWYEGAALGIAVWLIYMADHLLDVRGSRPIVSPRRLFHKRYFKQLVILSCAVACGSLFILFNLPQLLLFRGSVLLLLSLSYLLVAQNLQLKFKEPLVSLIYSFGVLLVPYNYLTEVHVWQGLLFVSLTVLALLNLVLLSVFETDQDCKEGHQSIISNMNSSFRNRTIWILILLNQLLALLMLAFDSSLSVAVFLFSAGLIYLSIWQFQWFQANERYRTFADLVFILPIIIVLLK